MAEQAQVRVEQRLQLAPARLLRGMQRAQGREQRGLGGEGLRVDLEQDISNINHWVHPLVIRHPDTGRRALYVSPLITARIEGLSKTESDTLLEELFRYQEDDGIIFEHKWQGGDLVMMDNRSITHARKDFPPGEPRMLRRTMVEGVTVSS